MGRLTYSPKFEHDCTCCAFLAHVAPATGTAFDLYRHESSVIARTGDDGPEYHCLPVDLADRFAGDVRSIMGRAFYVSDLLTKRRRFVAEPV